MSPGGTEATVDLVASLTGYDEALEVEWVLTNRGSGAIYFRAHPDDGRRAEVLEARAYSWLTPDEDALHLTLLNPPPDPSVDMERAILSLSRRLGPEERYRARIRVPLPAEEWNPCFPADPEPVTLVEVERIRLTTGWFPEDGLLWIADGPEAGTHWAQGRPYRSLETWLPTPAPFAVRKRLDQFRRV